MDLIQEHGISGMRYSISDTAEYGDMTRGKRIISEDVREEMELILEEIQTGEFAREWILENMAGRPVYNAIKREESEHEIEIVGRATARHDALAGQGRQTGVADRCAAPLRSLMRVRIGSLQGAAQRRNVKVYGAQPGVAGLRPFCCCRSGGRPSEGGALTPDLVPSRRPPTGTSSRAA